MKEDKIQELAERFFKERDLFPFNDDGTYTTEFKKFMENVTV